MRTPDDLAGDLTRATSVNFHLRPLADWLADPVITEICVNRPGEVFCESAGQWERQVLPALTVEHLNSLATATARFTADDISAVKPVLSATLPTGERIQIVRPPACEHETVSVTIRKPSRTLWTLDDFESQGLFARVQPVTGDLTPDERDLQALHTAGHYPEFLRLAVKTGRVILVVGETGSGKTTFMKALVQEIPFYLRLITIEDVPELLLPHHANHVHLFYPSEAKEEENAPVTAASLLRSCLRMRPDRILLAELRGGEAFDFLNVAASGHAGSITSCHAGSADLAFERLALMVLQNRQGRMLPYAVIRQLLYLVVDVIVHIHNDPVGGLGRHITSIWYDPTAKRAPATRTALEAARR